MSSSSSSEKRAMETCAKIRPASSPSASMSGTRCSMSPMPGRPCVRSRFWPTESRLRSSQTRCVPVSSRQTLGAWSRYFAGMRSTKRSGGSSQWSSAEMTRAPAGGFQSRSGISRSTGQAMGGMAIAVMARSGGGKAREEDIPRGACWPLQSEMRYAPRPHRWGAVATARTLGTTNNTRERAHA